MQRNVAMLLLRCEHKLKRLEKELVADDNAKWVAKHEATTPTTDCPLMCNCIDCCYLKSPFSRTGAPLPHLHLCLNEGANVNMFNDKDLKVEDKEGSDS